MLDLTGDEGRFGDEGSREGAVLSADGEEEVEENREMVERNRGLAQRGLRGYVDGGGTGTEMGAGVIRLRERG